MDKAYTILVVEDEEPIRKVVKDYLINYGYRVLEAKDGISAMEVFSNNEIHLIVLDLMLPLLSGEEVCSKIRSSSNVPIIMLTAKSDEDDKIEGFSAGADDYVVKPFSTKELLVRIEALIKRTYLYKTDDTKKIYLQDNRIVVDSDEKTVKKDGTYIDLTNHEFQLLLQLSQHKGNVLSRQQLIELAFGYDYEGYDRTIDAHIKNIRQKLEDNPKNPALIITVYGIGYRLNGWW